MRAGVRAWLVSDSCVRAWHVSCSAHARILFQIYLNMEIGNIYFHSSIMAQRVHVFSRELNAINDVKLDKQKCKRIIDQGRMELVYCICDCVHNILQGNIPVSEDEKELFKKHKEKLRKLVNKKTSDREKKHLIQEGGLIIIIIVSNHL